jgi:uncharacterized protein YcgI (DUF1989 family)
MERFEVPAGTGRAVPVRAGQQIRVIDVEGGQVADLFAFVAAHPTEHLSASHTRTATSRLFPAPGQSFVTDRRRPILTLTGDTSPGVHDMLIAACDRQRYADLGAPQHASCADNLRTAMAQCGVRTDLVPQPVNLFMHIPVDAHGDLEWLPAISRAGDAVTFEALLDCVVAVSACPMDLNAINGHRLGPLAIEIGQNSPR